MRIVNSYEKIAANVQIDFDKGIAAMAEGTQIAGSIARDAGLEFEELAAIIATTSETTRQEGSQIGNAMKTIMSRISRSKSDDEDTSAKDRSDAAKAYKEVADIDLYNENGSYKDLSDTLSELAGKWNTLTDAERNYIAEESAGIRNINIFTTMMNNYAKSMDLAKSALEDTGYAQEVQDKYMESMTAHMNSLRAATQEFWNNLFDTGAINLFIDAATRIVHTVSTITSLFTGLGDVVANAGDAIFDFTDNTSKAVKTITALSTAAIAGLTAWTIASETKQKGSLVKGIASVFGSSETKRGLTGGINQLKEIIISNFKTGKSLTSSGESGLIESMLAGDKGFAGLIQKVGMVAGKFPVLTKVLLGVGAAGAAIGATALAVDALTTSTEEAKEAAEKVREEYQKVQKETQTKKKQTVEITSEFEQLYNKMDGDLTATYKLNNEELERYIALSNQVAQMYPELVGGYDAQGNAILNLKNGVKSLNDEYERTVKLEANSRIANGEYGKAFENFNNQMGNRKYGAFLADTLSDWGKADRGGRVTNNEALKAIKGAQGMSYEELMELLKNKGADTNSDGVRYQKVSNNVMSYLTSDEVGLSKKMSKEEWVQWQNEIKTVTANISAELETATSDVKMYMNDYINTLTFGDDAEFDLEDSQLSKVTSFINKLSPTIIEELKEGEQLTEQEIQNFIYNLLSAFDENSDASLSLENLLSINENTDPEKLAANLEKDLEIVSKALNMNKTELTISLGLENEVEFANKVGDYVKKISNKVADDYKKQMDSIKAEFDVKDLERDIVDKETLAGKGYEIDSDSASYLPQVVENEDTAFVVSPILPDGSVLNKEEFTNYVNNTVLKGSEDVKGVKLAMFDKKQMTDATKQAHKFAKEIDLANDYAGDYNSTQKLAYAFMRDNNIATADELDLLWECVETTSSWAEALDKFTFENFNLEDSAEQIKALEDNLENVKKTIQDVDQAYNESMTSTGMTKESIENIERAFSSLEGYDYDKLFESTAEGIRLNVTELDRLSKAWEEQEASKYDSKLENLIDIYEQYCLKIANATDATERNKLIMERDGVAEQIREVQELTAMYDGLTNSVTDYFRSSQTNNKDHNFSRIAKDFEKMEKDFANGAIGTDDFKKYTQLFNFDDITNLNPEEIAKEYARVRELAMRYFTEDENGNGGKQGILNFMEDASKIMPEQIFKDADGNWTIGKDGFIDIEKLAEELDISEAMVLEFFNMAEYYGAQLDYSEETEFLKGMREEAEAGKETLKDYADELKNTGLNAEDFQFNFGELDTEDELKAAIDYSAELRESLVNTFGEGSDVVKAFDSQVEYMNAKLGEVMQQSNIDFFVNIHDNGAFEQLSSDLDVLNKTYETDINISWGNQDPEYWKLRMADLSEVINNLPRDVNGKINMESEGVQEALRLYDAALQKQQELNKPVVMQVDVSKIDDEGLQQGMTKVQELQSALNELARQKAEVQAGFNVDTSAAEANVSRIISSIQESNPTISAGLNLDSIAADADNAAQIAQQRLNEVTPEMLADLKLSEESLAEVEGYKPPDTELTVDADTELVKAAIDAIDADLQTTRTMSFTETGLGGIKSTFDGIKDKNVTITTTYKTVGSPPGGNGQGWVNGTANFGGRAYADGNIGAPRDEIALVGEEKPELRVNKRTGEWELLGENGAEFAKINKGDIIFNGKIFCHRI